LYRHEHGADGLCWDQIETHASLIRRLVRNYPDGWALSVSSLSLRQLLPLVPEDARVAVWVKPFCAFKRNVRPAYAWEGVIFRGGRNPGHGYRHTPPAKGGKQTTPKDFIAEPITLERGLTGAKPEAFCRWVLELLNVQAGDFVVDLYPGTGVMARVASAVTGSLIPKDPLQAEGLRPVVRPAVASRPNASVYGQLALDFP
jgi:hypothetical protein